MLATITLILSTQGAYIATIPDAAAAAPLAFLAGIATGFVLANRYQLTKRNGHEPGP